MEGMQAQGRSKTKPEIRSALSGPASPEKESAPPLEAATPYPVFALYIGAGAHKAIKRRSVPAVKAAGEIDPLRVVYHIPQGKYTRNLSAFGIKKKDCAPGGDMLYWPC